MSKQNFATTYYFAPNLRNPEWHCFTPGAIAGVILWLAASLGLRIYLHFFNTYNAAYGSLGAVIVLLLWFYLSGITLLAGAALNAVLETLAVPANVTQARKAAPFKAAY